MNAYYCGMNRGVLSIFVFVSFGALFLILATALPSSAQPPVQTAANKVAEIKKIVAERDRMAETAEGEEYSSVFIVELKVNPRENQYPAVGTFTSTVKFYYTYGDREKNPYPYKLVKIATVTRRASATERTTIYFRGPAEMVLYSKVVEGDNLSERSVFMMAGLPIQFERDGRVVSTKSADALAFTKEARAEKARLEKIFTATIE